MVNPLPSHGEMLNAIVATYRRASGEQVASGAIWYRRAGRIVKEIGHEFDIAPDRVAYALAALSPRNPWAWNVADAFAFAEAASNGADMPTATTYGSNKRAAWRALTEPGDEVWSTAAPKVRAFVDAVMGDEWSVVVDVWAMRVVTNGERSEPPSTKAYRKVAYAYAEAALYLGVTPCTAQAVTWLVAQAEGLGSTRRNRHDQTCKRGTHAFVRRLLDIT